MACFGICYQSLFMHRGIVDSYAENRNTEPEKREKLRPEEHTKIKNFQISKKQKYIIFWVDLSGINLYFDSNRQNI